LHHHTAKGDQMPDTYEIVMPSKDNPAWERVPLAVVKEIPKGHRKGWVLHPVAVMWGRSKKGHETPALAAAKFLRFYRDRGAFMRVRAPKS